MQRRISKINLFIVYFLIISYTKVLGIYQHEAGIGLGNLNVLGIIQIISVLLLVFGLLINLPKFTFTPSPIKKFIVIYFVIIIFSIVIGFRNVLLNDYSLTEYLHNIKTIYIYLFFIFLLSVFKTPNDIPIIFHIINNLAIVASVIVIYQVLFVKGAVVHGNMLYDQFRYMSTTGFLIAFSFFYFFSMFLQNKKISLRNIGLTLLTLIAVAIQMHRSVLLGLFFTILVGLLLKFNFKNSIKILSVTVILVTLVTVIILKITNFSVDYFDVMAMGTARDVSEGTGSLFIRFNTLINTFNDVFHNYFLLGRGFIWEKLDLLSYLKTFKAYAPTYDNTYTSVLICFGFIGFTNYLILIFTSVKHLLRKVKKNTDVYSLPLLLILVYYIIASFFGDYLFGFSNTIITLVMFFSIGLNISHFVSFKNGNYLVNENTNC